MEAQQKTSPRIAQAAAALLVLIVLPFEGAARVLIFRANVPFQFVVGRETLPAATYTVEVLLGQPQALDTTGVVVLKTPDGRVYRTAFTTIADGRRKNRARSSLIFKQLKGKHYLSVVTMATADLELRASNRVPPDATVSHSTEVPMQIVH